MKFDAQQINVLEALGMRVEEHTGEDGDTRQVIFNDRADKYQMLHTKLREGLHMVMAVDHDREKRG